MASIIQKSRDLLNSLTSRARNYSTQYINNLRSNNLNTNGTIRMGSPLGQFTQFVSGAEQGANRVASAIPGGARLIQSAGLQPRLPTFNSNAYKAGEIASNIVTTAPLFAGAGGLIGRGVASIPAVARSASLLKFAKPAAEVLGGAAVTSAITTPGSLKTRGQALAQQFSPANLAFSAPFIALGAAGVKGAFDAKKMRLLAPELGRAKSLLSGYEYYKPADQIKALQVAREMITKIGFKPSRQLQKLMVNQPQEYLNFARGLIDDALQSASNPQYAYGLSTKVLQKGKSAQAGLYDQSPQGFIQKNLPNAKIENGSIKLPDGTNVELRLGDNGDRLGIHWIEANKKGTGVGTKIVDSLKEYVKSKGINDPNHAGLIVEDSRNNAFWKKMGFVEENGDGIWKWTPTQEEKLAQLKNVAQQPLSGVKTKEALLGRKSLQSEGLPTIQTKLQSKSLPIQQVGGGALSGGQGGASQPPIIPPKSDPVQKIIEALKGAKPIRGEQEAIYSKIRSRQAGALTGIGGRMGGEQTYYQKLGQLKGELPKVQFESIKKQLTQPDIDSLFNKVEQSNLGVFEKVNAQTGLRKLLGEGGGTIPTERELELLNEVFPPEFIQAVLNNRSTLQKLLSVTEGVLNLPRAVMASADLSAPLRQGIFLVGRPKQWAPAFKEMFKFAFSEKAYKGFQESIKARPNAQLYREARLALTDMSPQLLKREEAFMSNLAEKIPVFGKIARGSNRAYSGFLNKLRADVFDDLVDKATKQGLKLEGKRLEDLGSFINSATGRGNLGKTLQKAAPLLNATFFSPRLMASRINLLNPVTYIKYDPFVRKEALKSLLGFGATAGTILGLASMGGADVGTDPRSADFGKIKVGNTRYDILGGFQQYIKLGAQLLSGQIVSSTSGKIMTLGEGYKPLTRKDIIARFFESKEAPIASFITGLLTGQTGIGEPFNLSTEIINRFIPMVAQDIYDIAKDQDSIGKGLMMGLPGVFGVGSQTYGKQELVFGKNKVGQDTAQVRPVRGLAESISEKAFGKQPLGSSAGYNVETYYDQMLKMPKAEARQLWDQIVKTNPELAKKIKQVIKDREKGITVQDQVLKAKGVASGDRAVAIVKEFNKLKTPEEKSALWDAYVKKGIITKDVATQIKKLLQNQ